jgi:hypothetical protein
MRLNTAVQGDKIEVFKNDHRVISEDHTGLGMEADYIDKIFDRFEN